MMNKLLAIIFGLLIVGGAYIFFLPVVHQDPPKLKDVYWGPGDEPKYLDESIRPFNINFSREMIDDLRLRLNRTRELQSPLEDAGWTYGVNSNAVPKLVDYWHKKYDFKKREIHLNRYPQFVTNVQGLDIHFIHVKPQLPKDRNLEVVPLYIQHGWPGSVVEFFKIIPLLTTPHPKRDFVFEVVAPSLPGFAYSQPAAKAGLGAIEIAHLMKNLMLRLGFNKFYTQGGDWGAFITSSMAAMYPQHVLGMHSNMCMVLRPMTMLKMWLYNLIPSLLPDDDRKMMVPFSDMLCQFIEETGYLHLQATKPDTLGIAFTDSPIGLAAYILEKFSLATNMKNKFREDGNLLEKFNMDELLDNLMFYWAPNKATSAIRIYAESFNKHATTYRMDNVLVNVPSACAQFPHEIVFHPTSILKDRFSNLVSVTKMPRGGHFAAMEEPELLAEDIWNSVQTIRGLNATIQN